MNLFVDFVKEHPHSINAAIGIAGVTLGAVGTALGAVGISAQKKISQETIATYMIQSACDYEDNESNCNELPQCNWQETKCLKKDPMQDLQQSLNNHCEIFDARKCSYPCQLSEGVCKGKY